MLGIKAEKSVFSGIVTHSCLLCGPSVGVRSIQTIPMPGPCGSPTKDTFPENEIGQPRDDQNQPRTLTRDLGGVRAHPASAIFHSTTPRQRSGLRHRRHFDRYSSLDELIAAIAFFARRWSVHRSFKGGSDSRLSRRLCGLKPRIFC